MARLPFLLSIVISLAGLGAAWDINNNGDRRECQRPSREPLDGCDKSRTVFVDPVNPKAGFKTVQSAVASLPNNADTYVILIGSGNYTEQVNVTRRGPTYLLGQTSHPQNYTLNTASIIWAAAAGTRDNAYTSTLTVAPNLNASFTGSGPTGFPVPDDTPFGCIDFRTYNVDFINDYAPYSAGPALALSISRANGGFYYSGFYSYQDTVYVGKLANAFIKGGEVAGQTDFFYGFGTAYVTHTLITLRSCGGGITAWKGTNSSTTDASTPYQSPNFPPYPNKFGIYITRSRILAANSSLLSTSPAPGTKSILAKCALGRPWNALHRSIIAETYLDQSILPTGYIDWAPSRYNVSITLQGEYRNYGPGWNATARAAAQFERLIGRDEWGSYDRAGDIFGWEGQRDKVGEGKGWGNDAWVDYHA